MYIITKFESVAKPDINRQAEKLTIPFEKIVRPLPMIPNKWAIMRTGSLPITSASIPKISVPSTDPMKNVDCPNADFHAF